MKVTLHRLDDAFHFLAQNEDGNEVHFDLTPEEGGTGQGAGPMQTVMMCLAGCSSIDVISILQKARQPLEDFDVEVEYERAAGQVPSLFTTVHMHFLLTGDLEVEKVRRAIDLSVNKYCSVAKILEKTAMITTSFSVNGTRYDD
jgi:putative redox protein